MTGRSRYREDPAALDTEERTTAAGARIPAGWLREAADLLRQFEDSGQPVTPAALRAAGLSEPPHPAHWGGLMSHLHRAGLVRLAGLALHRAADGCQRPRRVWAAVPQPDPAEAPADASAAA